MPTSYHDIKQQIIYSPHYKLFEAVMKRTDTHKMLREAYGLTMPMWIDHILNTGSQIIYKQIKYSTSDITVSENLGNDGLLEYKYAVAGSLCATASAPPSLVYGVFCYAYEWINQEGWIKNKETDNMAVELLREIAQSPEREYLVEFLTLCPKLRESVPNTIFNSIEQQPTTLDELFKHIRDKFSEEQSRVESIKIATANLKADNEKLKADNEKLKTENLKYVSKCQELLADNDLQRQVKEKVISEAKGLMERLKEQEQNETIIIERGMGKQVKSHKTSAKEVVDAIKDMNKLDAMTKEEWKQLLSRITGLSPTSFQNYIR